MQAEYPEVRGNASHILERREVEMIFRGPHKVGSGRRARDRYSQKVKKPLQTMVHTTGSKPPIGYTLQPDNIVFTQVATS